MVAVTGVVAKVVPAAVAVVVVLVLVVVVLVLLVVVAPGVGVGEAVGGCVGVRVVPTMTLPSSSSSSVDRLQSATVMWSLYLGPHSEHHLPAHRHFAQLP